MRKFNSLFRKANIENNNLEEDILIELSNDDADKVMAVGNSVQSGKWFFYEDMKYSILKRCISK